MSHFLRIFSPAVPPPADKLSEALPAGFTLEVEQGDDGGWEQLVLKRAPDGPVLAVAEHDEVSPGSMAHEELAELADELAEARPTGAAKWVKAYFHMVRSVTTIEIAAAVTNEADLEAVQALQGRIWSLAGGILQSEGEGFTNEDGHHVVWQFDDDATGAWKMAVLDGDEWVAFEMDLGDIKARETFLSGKMPKGAKEL